MIPVSKRSFSLSVTMFLHEGIRMLDRDNINGLEKKSRHTNDATNVFLLRIGFLEKTAIVNNTTIQVIGENRKSRILER